MKFSVLLENRDQGKTTDRAFDYKNCSYNIWYNFIQWCENNGDISHKLDRQLKTKIQMIYQDPTASLNERANVDYILSEGIRAFHMYKTEEEQIKNGI